MRMTASSPRTWIGERSAIPSRRPLSIWESKRSNLWPRACSPMAWTPRRPRSWSSARPAPTNAAFPAQSELWPPRLRMAEPAGPCVIFIGEAFANALSLPRTQANLESRKRALARENDLHVSCLMKVIEVSSCSRRDHAAEITLKRSRSRGGARLQLWSSLCASSAMFAA